MKVFGAVDFQPPGWMTDDENIGDLAVLPDNWDAVQSFLACGTQWHRGPKGESWGLRYDALEVVMRRLRVRQRDDCWIRVRIMELEALKELAKQRD